MKFAEYIKNKRIINGISQSKAAKMYGISLSYLSSIERGIRPAPTNDILEKIAKTLGLSDKEKYRMLDLAAESKKPPELAGDLVEYINSYPFIRDTLRYSLRCNMSDKDWKRVFSFIKKNYFY